MYDSVLGNDVALTLTDCFWIPLDGFDVMNKRAFTAKASERDLRNVENVVGETFQRGGTNINIDKIVGTVPHLMGVSDTPGRVVPIANSWSTKRITFVMRFESTVSSLKQINYVQGYSDFYEDAMISNNNSRIPENIVLNVNSIITLKERLSVGPDGQTYSTYSVEETSDVMTGLNNNRRELANLQTEREMLLRPEDLLGMVENLEQTQNSPDITSINGFSDVHHGSIRFNNRANNDPLHNMNKVISATYATSARGALNADNSELNFDFGYEDERGAEDIYNRASAMASEKTSPLINKFFISLDDAGVQGNNFTLNNLRSVIPSILNEKAYRTPAQRGMPVTAEIPQQFKEPGLQMGYLSDTIKEATLANQFLTSLLSEMVTTYINSISFSITTNPSVVNSHNASPMVHSNGKAVCILMSYTSFLSEYESYITTKIGFMIQNILNRVMPSITENWQRNLTLQCDCSVFTEGFVSIAIEGKAPVCFRMPNMCSSLVAPVRAYSEDVGSLTASVKAITDTVIDTVHNVSNNKSVITKANPMQAMSGIQRVHGGSQGIERAVGLPSGIQRI